MDNIVLHTVKKNVEFEKVADFIEIAQYVMPRIPNRLVINRGKSMRRYFCLALTLLFVWSCSSSRQFKPAPQKWAVNQLKKLTLEEKVGQMFAPAFHPRYYNEDNAYFERLLDMVRKNHIGGVAFYRGETYAVARCIERLQRESKHPLLVMADVEWGIPMRIDHGTEFLQNMALGATGSEEYAYQMGEVTAREAKAIGVHMAYAPVVDVNNNPDNIIINTRSYGEDPAMVGKLGSAYIRGLQSQGVYATAKHYPGHGDTDVDSHLGLPTITASQERIRNVELAPFRDAVAAGVKGIMVSHITFSAFPQMEGRPATLDKYFIEDVLRKEMGFDGLLISDAMDMGGITRNYWSGEAAVAAINAGVDVILIPPDLEATCNFVIEAVREGRISMAHIDEAVSRILRVKGKHGLHRHPTIDLDTVEKHLASPENLAKAQEIADASMTLLKDDKSIFPFHADTLDSVLVVSITDRNNASSYASTLTREVARRIPTVKQAYIDPRTSEGEIREIIEMAEKSRTVIAGIFVRWGSHKGSVSLPDTTVKLLDEFFKIDKPMAVASFGSPYVIRQLPEIPSYICAYGTAPLAVASGVKAMFGEIPFQGKLPVSIPGYFNIGDGLQGKSYDMTLTRNIDETVLQEAFGIIEQAIADTIFPGAQLAIVRNGELITSRAFGHQTYAADAPAVTTETIYDLASVTKVAATASVSMQLWEQGKLNLDIPVNSYLPLFSGPDKDKVTLRHLFSHSSGAHWWADLWNKSSNKKTALDYIYNLPLDYTPGDSMIYSDLGLIMIGKVLETVTNQSIDQLAMSRLYKPLGMTSTMYNPPAPLLPRIAPTEIGGSMNRGLIHGDVHDENTHFLNGVSTHAGLFSTAEDLAKLAQMFLNGGIYDHHRIYKPYTIKYWTRRQLMPESSIRALGWTTPHEGSLAGDYYSDGSFGHTGFTGTSMWIDPNYDIAIILLTNRVHPTRTRGGIGDVRRAFHSTAMKALLEDMGVEIAVPDSSATMEEVPESESDNSDPEENE